MDTLLSLCLLCNLASTLAQEPAQYRRLLFVAADPRAQAPASPQGEVSYPQYTVEEMALSKRQYQAAFSAMASQMAAQRGVLASPIAVPRQNAILYGPPVRGLLHRKLVAQVPVEPQTASSRHPVYPPPARTVQVYRPTAVQQVYNQYESEAPLARPVQVIQRPAFARVHNVKGQYVPRPVPVYPRPSQQVQYEYGTEQEQPQQELLVVLPNGYLADTQEVQAAKEAHLAEVARSLEAAARSAAREAQARPTPVQYNPDNYGRQYYTVQQPATRYVKYVTQ